MARPKILAGVALVILVAALGYLVIGNYASDRILESALDNIGFRQPKIALSDGKVLHGNSVLSMAGNAVAVLHAVWSGQRTDGSRDAGGWLIFDGEWLDSSGVEGIDTLAAHVASSEGDPPLVRIELVNRRVLTTDMIGQIWIDSVRIPIYAAR